MSSSKGPCPRVWACATTDTLMICYGHYHTCYHSAGHTGECESGTGVGHTSGMRHGEIVDSVTAVYEVMASRRASRPAWIDDHRAQELRTFRARFTDEEWALFRGGSCGWLTEYGTGREVRCGESRRHARIYCDQHTRQARETSSAATYGALSVPSAVSSMDLSEVP